MYVFAVDGCQRAAATLTATKTAATDDGVCNADCSLREAIDVAADGDTINFSSLFNTPQTIYAGGSFEIFDDLDIVGTGADLLTINGGITSDVFNTSGAVTLSGMTITGANSTGIVNNGDLTIDGCVITENTGATSGGVQNEGTLTINNSTISENTSNLLSGGIKNGGDLTITNTLFQTIR